MEMPAVRPFDSGIEHLLWELKRLDFMLQRQVLRLRAAGLLVDSEFRGLYIPDNQADALLRRAGGRPGEDSGLEQPAIELLTARIRQLQREGAERLGASLSAHQSLPLAFLAREFALSAFETDALVLAVAAELDTGYGTLFAYAQNDATRRRPTVDLAIKLSCERFEDWLVYRAAFSHDAPLFRSGLLTPTGGPATGGLLDREMRLDQRLVDFLLEREGFDGRLQGFTRIVDRGIALDQLVLPASARHRLQLALQTYSLEGAPMVLRGPRGSGKRTVAGAVARALSLPLLTADMELMPAGAENLSSIARVLVREARLRGSGLCVAGLDSVTGDDPGSRGEVAAALAEFADLDLPLILTITSDLSGLGETMPHASVIQLSLPDYPSRLALWEQACEQGRAILDTDVSLRSLGNRFLLGPGQIFAAVREGISEAGVRAGGEVPTVSAGDLERAARAQSNPRLAHLLQKVEPKYGWSDIVLPEDTLRQLHEVATSVRRRHIVYWDWGFDHKLSLGKGLDILFAGPSGTGKTMAAEVLAHELGLDLYRADLSTILSKWLGETERQLSKIFHEALTANAIVVFDEADALFGKRAEVSEARDRYANVEVAYLLQKIEEYEGIVILATNLSDNLDDAFIRRMHHAITFRAPDARDRERIWRTVFPPEAPLDPALDFKFVAHKFEFAGGNIKGAALAAAFMASEEGEAIGMSHVLAGTAREIRKLGRVPKRADFGPYAGLVEALL